MKARSVSYWLTTVLFSLGIGASAIADLVRAPALVEGLTRLGYPAYLATLLGVWKVLGVAAILAPRAPRLKEWAYAGFAFELTGAVYSHVASGDGAHAGGAAVLLLVAAASWALRPATRRFGAVLPAATTAMHVAAPAA